MLRTLRVNYHFDACHMLNRSECTKEANEATYGACNGLHGHRWNVKLEICGDVTEAGWVVNFKDVKQCIDKYDHAYLNDLVEVIPTAENLAEIILNDLMALGSFKYVKVSIFETPDCEVEVDSRNGY